MAFTLSWYGLQPAAQYDGSSVVDWDTDTIRAMLCTSAYVPNQDTHEFKSSVTNEITGTGYTARGEQLTSPAVTYDTASNTVRMDAANTAWTSATFTARQVVVYKDTGVDGTSPLLAYGNFGSDQSVSGGTFTLQWDATDGVIRIVVS
jgi:hypothetical protein